MKPSIRVVKGNISRHRGRIGRPFDRAKPQLRKSQRRIKQRDRHEFNANLRRRYGCRNKAMLGGIVYELFMARVLKAAKNLNIDMVPVDDSVPSPWPALTDRIKRKMVALK